jgi:hypothetical protein
MFIESMDEKLTDLNSSNQIDVAELQRNLFLRYKGNPVLNDAIQGRQSVEDSLEELGQVNAGIRQILPWRKNKEHNERLKQLGELVTEPSHLRTYGIFVLDNLITTQVELTAMAFGLSYLMSRYLYPPNPGVSPEEYQQTMHVLQVTMPTAMSAMAPVFGLLANVRRFTGLPTDEAKYLDGKVQEFYK